MTTHVGPPAGPETRDAWLYQGRDVSESKSLIGSCVVQRERTDDMELVAELMTARQRELGAAAVMARALAALRVGLEALELGVEQEVHDARDRVGTVRGGRAARHDFDAFHQLIWERGDVNRTESTVRHGAPTIEQHERA